MEEFAKERLIAQAVKTWTSTLDRGGQQGALTARSVHELLLEALKEQGQEVLDRFFDADNAATQMIMIGLPLWADAGFPQIEMSHKFAAALLVSDVGEETLAHVRQPWRAFFIEVPDGMLHIHDPEQNGPAPVRRIFVVENDAGEKGACWSYIAFTSGRATLWRFSVTADALLPPAREVGLDDYGTLELTDHDSRVSALIGRLIITTCFALASPGLSKEAGPGHRAWTEAGGRASLMKGRTRRFVVGRPVVIDLRDRVREYVEGHRSKVEVRSLVRGHYRLQHFGEGRLETKVIWIEPHWRGPEDAATVVRPHVIKAD